MEIINNKMKKIMLTVGLSLLTGSLWAACMGPFCYDDSGASIGGLSFDGAGSGLPNASSATIVANTPKAKGVQVFCTTCVAANTLKGVVCISTGTTASSWEVYGSTLTSPTACQ
jgi:hypothetical protein